MSKPIEYTEPHNKTIADYKNLIDIFAKNNNNLKTTTTVLKGTNKDLKTASEKLKSKLDNLNKLACQYCDRRYCSIAGVVNHINNKCEEKNKMKFLAVIDLNRFRAYIELLVENWDTFKQTYGFSMKLIDWNGDKPKLQITKKNKKEFTYFIYKNSGRAKVLNILNEKKTLPINLLIVDDLFEMFKNNQSIISIIEDFYKYGAGLMADEFEKIINGSDSEIEYDDSDFDYEDDSDFEYNDESTINDSKLEYENKSTAGNQ